MRYPDRERVPEDEELLGNLRLAFDLDPDVEASEIDVTADSGWVTLRGAVPDLWQKQLAEEMTGRARGVLGYDNQLVVVPTRAVVDPDEIDITVTNGDVILTGTMDDWTTRNAVYDAARHSVGVLAVHDRLTMRGSS